MSTAQTVLLGAIAGFTIYLGLAVGQAAHSGEISLATLLIVGFGLHNATEGFGVVGPLGAAGVRASWGWLGLAGLIGGGPTFLGTIVGTSFDSAFVYVGCLALAAGAILYVIGEILPVGRRLSWEITLWGLAAGFLLGVATDMVVEASGGYSAARLIIRDRRPPRGPRSVGQNQAHASSTRAWFLSWA